MFENLLESSTHRDRTKKPAMMALSFTLHAAIILGLIIGPLFFPDALPQVGELLGFVQSPLNPAIDLPKPVAAQQAPPPIAPPKVDVPKTTLDPSQVYEPKEITKDVPDVKPEKLEMGGDLGDIGMPGGVPGGVPGGAVGGAGHGGGGSVVGGVPIEQREPPKAPPPPPKEPVRVGGNVLSSQLVQKVEPIYPEIAKKARVAGIVLLQIVVDESGRVSEVKVLSGHPMLVQAAVDAVKKWAYTPTVLNGEKIPMIGTVTVIFKLN